MVLLQLGKEIPPEAIGEISSSSPEIGGSGDSSLTNGHSSFSDLINDWRRELEEKNSELRHKIAINNSLEERLQEKELELCETRNECKAAQFERDKNCQVVSFNYFHFINFFARKCISLTTYEISYALFLK